MMLKALKSFFKSNTLQYIHKRINKNIKDNIFFEKNSQKEYFQNVMPGHELNVER